VQRIVIAIGPGEYDNTNFGHARSLLGKLHYSSSA
jgi:hypothetical protein